MEPEGDHLCGEVADARNLEHQAGNPRQPERPVFVDRERRGVDRIAPEIPVEVAMTFQQRDRDPLASLRLRLECRGTRGGDLAIFH